MPVIIGLNALCFLIEINESRFKRLQRGEVVERSKGCALYTAEEVITPLRCASPRTPSPG